MMVSSMPPRAIGNERYKPLTGFKWWFRPAGLLCLPRKKKRRMREAGRKCEREKEDEGEVWHAETNTTQVGNRPIASVRMERSKNNRNAVDAAWLQSDLPSRKWRLDDSSR